MLSNFLNRSKPIHYIAISLLLTSFFIGHFISELQFFETVNTGVMLYVDRFGVLTLLISSLLISDYIVKNNKLDTRSSFIYLVNVLLYLIFWDVFSNTNLVISNFLLITGLHSLISSDFHLVTKERLFRASLFICLAAFFNFWAILYLILVFQTILFNFQNDIKRLYVPFIAVSVVFIWFAIFTVAQYGEIETTTYQLMQYDWGWFQFKSPIKEALFWFYVFLIWITVLSFFMNISDMAKKIRDSYIKFFLIMLIAVPIIFLSVTKTENLLIYTFFPVSVLLSKFIERGNKNWIQNLLITALIIVTILSCSSYYWEQFLY